LAKFTSSKKKDIFSFEMLTKLQRLFSFKNDPLLRFNFLTDLCGIHYPDEVDRQFTIVYHMHNWYENKRIKIKTFINGEKPEIKPFLTFSSVQTGWKEKPMILRCRFWTQLKRILNMDEMVSFPMQRIPMEDGGRTDKDDRFSGRIDNC
jgi:NADH-quinone oxidoreductase subunit C